MVLFEGNPVSCDHRPVEGESRQRSAAWRGSRHQGLNAFVLRLREIVIFEGRWRDSKRLQRLWSAVSLRDLICGLIEPGFETRLAESRAIAGRSVLSLSSTPE